MKRNILVSISSFIIPLYGMVAIMSGYLPHVYYANIIAHTILLIVMCSTAFSICYFFYINYVHTRVHQFFAVAVFFEISGIVFLFHAISIPSFYFLNEGIFDVTEHFGFLFSCIIVPFLFSQSAGLEEFFYKNRHGITRSIALMLLVWFILLVYSNELTEYFFAYVNYANILSGVLLIVGILALLKNYRAFAYYASYSYLIAGLSIMINATVAPFFYREWNVLWWYFHIIILCANLIIFLGVLKKCNKKVCVLTENI